MRFVRQCSRQCDPLRLATRQFVWAGVAVVTHADAIEPVARDGPRELLFDALAGQSERNVVEQTKVWEQQVILKHHADVALLRRHEHGTRATVDERARQDDLAALDVLQAREHSQHGRLASAVRAQQCECLAVTNLQADVEL